jgi:hypothetical protein
LSPVAVNDAVSVEFDMDASLVYEVGLGARWDLGNFDVGVSLDYRRGEGTTSYDYWYVRPGLVVGLRATEAVRPYVGVRYTAYHGTLAGMKGLELERPVGLSIGLEVGASSIVARLEVQAIDVELGFVAGVEVKF